MNNVTQGARSCEAVLNSFIELKEEVAPAAGTFKGREVDIIYIAEQVSTRSVPGQVPNLNMISITLMGSHTAFVNV